MLLALVWILALAAAALPVALALALPARLGWRVAGGLLGLLAAAPSLALGALTVWVAARVRDSGAEPSRLWYFSSWLVADAVVLAAVFILGLRRGRGDRLLPAAGTWRLPRLLAGVILAPALLAGALWLLDRSVRAEADRIGGEAEVYLRSVAIPDLPEDRNAAPLYAEAERLAGRTSGWPGSASSFGDPEVGRFLGEMREPLRLIREAARRPAAWKPDAEVYQLVGISFGRYSTCWRLLILDARWRIRMGDLPGVLEDLDALEGSTRQNLRVPSLVTFLVGTGLWSNGLVPVLEEAIARLDGFPALERLRTMKGIPFLDLARRAPSIEEPFGRVSFREAWRDHPDHELLFSLHDDFQGLSGEPDLPEAILRERRLLPFRRMFYFHADLEAFTRGHAAWRALAGKPLPELLEASNLLQESGRSRIFWIGSTLAHLDRSIRRAAACEARQETLRLGLAAAAFRKARGRYPATAGELVPEYLEAVPADPRGTPIRLVPSPDGLDIRTVTVGDDGTEETESTFALGSAYHDKKMREAAVQAAARDERDEEDEEDAEEADPPGERGG